jgi:hypothetical protein
MIVVFDTSLLIDYCNVKLQGERRQKLDYLVISLIENHAQILIPSPAWAELLVGTSAATSPIMATIDKSAHFKIVPFDKRAAIECAMLLKAALPKKQQKDITRTKLKFDWQIIATAIVQRATTIYSDDVDISHHCSGMPLQVVRIDDLPLPKEDAQGSFELVIPKGE